MTQSITARALLAGALALTAEAAFAQGRVNTDIDTALKISRLSGRPILAIAGKKT